MQREFKLKVINWRLNYCAVFHHLSEPQCKVWEDWLTQQDPGIQPEEIDNAVANMCGTWDQGEKKRQPGVKDIFFRILGARKVASNRRYGYEDMDPYEADLRRRIEAATPTEDLCPRWDLICKGRTLEECIRLHEYADSLPGKCFPHDHSEFAKKLAAVMAGTGPDYDPQPDWDERKRKAHEKLDNVPF